MSLDTTRYDELTHTKHMVVREWDIDGHAVALMRYEGIDIFKKPYSGEDLYCECSFVFETREVETADGEKQFQVVHTKDSHGCEFKKKARLIWGEEARTRYGKRWQRLGINAAILDIFLRVTKRKERLGQFYSRMIYVQEVAELLQVEEKVVWQACAELFKEEKLDLYGAILTRYKKRFRFPLEIENLFAYIVEEPLGWPNGEAGDGFVQTLEAAIHTHTRYRHGTQAFREENWPYLAPHHLFYFGISWTRDALIRAHTDPEALKDLAYFDFEYAASSLREFADACDALAPKAKALQIPFPNEIPQQE